MALKARLMVLVVCLAFLLQSCGAPKIQPDEQATVEVAIQQTLTAQSISITATSLFYSRLTPAPEQTLTLPPQIPDSGGFATPAATTAAVMSDANPPTASFAPSETPTSSEPDTRTPNQTPSHTPTATAALIGTLILPPPVTGSHTSTPPATITVIGAPTSTSAPPPTATASALPSPVPSFNPTFTTLQVPPTGAPMLSVQQPTNCRAGPGISYDLLGYLYPNRDVAVVGFNPALNYWIVLNPEINGACWVWGGYAAVHGEMGLLPTVVPPPPPEQPRIAVSADTLCRSGPGQGYTILGGLPANASADLTGRLSNLDWWLIRNPGGSGNCWIPGDQATITGNVQALPVLDIPDSTPTPAATATPPPTPTATMNLSVYRCELLSQVVQNGAIFKPGANLDGNWVVKNTGSAVWEAGVVEIHFIAGTEMYKYSPAYRLTKPVEAGRRTLIIVDLVAPKTPGRYETTWGLTVNGQVFCQMPLSIVVVQP